MGWNLQTQDRRDPLGKNKKHVKDMMIRKYHHAKDMMIRKCSWRGKWFRASTFYGESDKETDSPGWPGCQKSYNKGHSM